MPGIAAAGIGNDFPAGQTGIRCGAAQNKTTSGIDIDFGIGIPQHIRNRG